MRKAWCDICGKAFDHFEDTEIGSLKMDSAYSDEFTDSQIHRKMDVCRECLKYVDDMIEERIYEKKPKGYKGYFEEGEF